MEQEKFEVWMMEYLLDTLEEEKRKEFEKFLRDNSEYHKQFEGIKQTWKVMDDLPTQEPTQGMDDKFFGMLYVEMEKAKKSKSYTKSWLTPIIDAFWKPQVAYGILLLGTGLVVGYFMNSEASKYSVPTGVVSSLEIEKVREQLVLTLLEQPSANQRLQGINEVSKIENIDNTVINALLQTLNNDANVNVRLAAIESLTNYLEEPIVREGLVQSIVKQNSPIIQITLANLMVALQEKKSIEPFKTLMRDKELNQSVKKKLETSINSII